MEGMKKEFKVGDSLLVGKIFEDLFKNIWVVISWTVYKEIKNKERDEGKEIIELDWGSEWCWTSRFVDGHDVGRSYY